MDHVLHPVRVMIGRIALPHQSGVYPSDSINDSDVEVTSGADGKPYEIESHRAVNRGQGKAKI